MLLGAQTPLRVYLKRKLTDAERNTGVSVLLSDTLYSDRYDWQRGESLWSFFIPEFQETSLDCSFLFKSYRVERWNVRISQDIPSITDSELHKGFGSR